jgi:hypothetical protein
MTHEWPHVSFYEFACLKLIFKTAQKYTDIAWDLSESSYLSKQ